MRKPLGVENNLCTIPLRTDLLLYGGHCFGCTVNLVKSTQRHILFRQCIGQLHVRHVEFWDVTKATLGSTQTSVLSMFLPQPMDRMNQFEL
jgi:hypothetical protein